MPTALLLLIPVHADPGAEPAESAFELVRDDGTCLIARRDRTDTTPSAMRATCTWPDVERARLDGLLADFEGYEDLIWVVDQSTVRERRDDRALVYQLQQMWGMADREVLLWAWSEDVPSGRRHVWTTASDEPLELGRGAVRTPINEGVWEVVDNPDGPGVRVTHEIAVDAGGTPLPEWLLRFVRTRGFARVMDEVRAHAR